MKYVMSWTEALIFHHDLPFIPLHYTSLPFTYSPQFTSRHLTLQSRLWDGLRCHDIHTKFHKNCFRHYESNRVEGFTDRQHGDLISVLLFDLRVFTPLKCNVVRCSFIRHYFTTCFGLTGHLQVYRLLWLRVLLLTVMRFSFLLLWLPLVILVMCVTIRK
jgi:hypothetical protein